jgi:hypothetical protein
MLFGDIAVRYKNGKFSRAPKSLTEGTEGRAKHHAVAALPTKDEPLVSI